MQRILSLFLGLFFAIRIVLNLSTTPLSVFFLISYVVLIALIVQKSRAFLPLAITFLAIDSMIGTYLFTTAGDLNIEYYGTMAMNTLAALLAIWRERFT